MSKFDFGTFSGGYDEFAASKEKYTKEQAIQLYCIECNITEGTKIAVMDAFVRHRVGWDEDNERCCGWWLEYREHPRSCPVYAFHEVLEGMPQSLESEYEWITVKGGAEKMNRYEKALERIKKVVEPTDDWSADDREHYLTIVRALEFMCAVTVTDGCPQETEPWMEAVSEIREGDRL